MIDMKYKIIKHCPRCNKKMPSTQPVCDGCGLIFSRLEKVSNSAGKEALKKGEKNKVIFDKTLPKDVNKLKLILFTIFLGWLGLQYHQVGRKKLFLYQLISFCLLVLFAILLSTGVLSVDMVYHKYWGFLCWTMIFPATFGLIIWFISVVQVIFGAFRVPVAIDEEIVLNEFDKKVASEILSEVKAKKIQNNKIIKSKKIIVVCKSCGSTVKVIEGETICPKCDENLKG